MPKFLLIILKIFIPYRNTTFIIKTDEETFINILDKRTQQKLIDLNNLYAFKGIINKEKKSFNIVRGMDSPNKSGADFLGKYRSEGNVIVETRMGVTLRFFIASFMFSFTLCLFAGYTKIINIYWIIGGLIFMYIFVNITFLVDVYYTKKRFAYIYSVRGYEVEVIDNGFKKLVIPKAK